MSDATNTAKMPGLAEERPLPPLLALPAELRNRIYEMAIINKIWKELRINDNFREPPLTSVCRQLRHETREMWYINHRFSVKIWRTTKKQLEAWWRLSEGFEGELKVRIEGWGTEKEMSEKLAHFATSELFKVVEPISKVPMRLDDEFKTCSAYLVRKR